MMKNQRMGRRILWMSAIVMALAMTLGVTRSAEARRRGNPKKTFKKIGPYIYGLNTLSKKVNHSYRYYTMPLKNKKAGPTCRERSMSLGMVQPKKVCKGIRRASRKRPRFRALEKAGKKYCKAAFALKKITAKLSGYYRTRAFKLDNCKKGKRAHAKLMKTFNAFFQANSTIHKEVARIQAEVDVTMRKQLSRRYGKNMRYWRHVGPREARRALHIARAEQYAKTPNPRRVLKAALEVERLVITMTKVWRKHDRKAIRCGFRSYVTYMRLYSTKLLRYAKTLEKTGAKRANYFYKKISGAFNTMIAHVNRVRFKKGMR